MSESQRRRWLAAGVASLALAGCGGRVVAPHPANATFSIAPADLATDTNCVGCDAAGPGGAGAEQFRAALRQGGAAPVVWSVSGGDPEAGPGAITADGLYTPPTFLTSDRVQVVVTAALRSDPSVRATALLTLTPGFQQPLTPQNAAVAPGGSARFTATLAEAGGGATVRFRLAAAASGAGMGLGSLGPVNCQRHGRSFTACMVEYTAPARPQAGAVTYLIAEAGQPQARMDAAILLDAGGVSSSPAVHQSAQAAPAALGSSGGNAGDYDAREGAVVDCCSGTLGALVEDAAGRRFLLSNNHVLARSDQARVGDAIVQPGMIDSSCTPGAGKPIATLKSWLPLSSAATNVDAALAAPMPRAVDATGSILELGARRADGSLAAAPPGTSSSGGKGVPARLDLRVAKSGRTTGLTCGGVTAIDVDIAVDYFRDCAETKSYLTKRFTHQLGFSGNRFADAGDSGALIVDAASAEPVGLYFAGGRDVAGVAQGLATPAAELLAALGAHEGSSFTFAGGADHAVHCLDYGDSTVGAAQARALGRVQIARVRHALEAARSFVKPASGVLGVALGKSSDRPGEAALIVYVGAGSVAPIPAALAGVRTMVIVADAQTVASGSAPLANFAAPSVPLAPAAVERALAVNGQSARTLMQRTPSIFGVGVGRSLDNPREAALVLYVDRRRAPAELPQTVGGVRTRIIVMDRLHVTRSFVAVAPSRCSAPQADSLRPAAASPVQ